MALFGTKKKNDELESDSCGCCAPSGSDASCGSVKDTSIKPSAKAK